MIIRPPTPTTQFQAIKNSNEDEFRQWLDRESEEVNHYRGGFASGGGFTVQDGTALHWAAYYGSYPIAKMLIDRGAGVVLLSCNTSICNCGQQLTKAQTTYGLRKSYSRGMFIQHHIYISLLFL